MWKTNLVILFFVLLFVALSIGLSGYRDTPAPNEATPLESPGTPPYEGAAPKDEPDDGYYDRGPLDDEESPRTPGEPEVFEASLL
jgi:hypothetical protein